MENTNQVSDNDQLWKEISIAYRVWIKPERQKLHLQYRFPMFPFLKKGRYMEDLV